MKEPQKTFVNSARCPLMQRLAGILKASMRRLRRQIERLPPYPALAVLAGLLAVVEPLKLATIFVAGERHWITSALVVLFAYAVSICHPLAVRRRQTKMAHPSWFAQAWSWFVAARGKTWRWVAIRAKLLA